jgi:hypothetical protein
METVESWGYSDWVEWIFFEDVAIERTPTLIVVWISSKVQQYIPEEKHYGKNLSLLFFGNSV